LIGQALPVHRAIALIAALAAAPAAAGTTGRVRRVDAAPSREVVVPGGTFVMGIAADDVDGLVSECRLATRQTKCEEEYRVQLGALAAHQVHVSTFAIDRKEVTVREYKACVEAGGCALDPLVSGPAGYTADDLPIVEVTWPEAHDYCAWRRARLPTEAEWERAARGDDGRIWPWGDADRADDWNHGKPTDEITRDLDATALHSTGDYFYGLADDSDGSLYAAPPGAYRWGEGPFGTLDQAGNVAEWVADVWSVDGYGGLGTDDPVRDTGAPGPLHHVFRGGSWAQAPYLGRADVRDPYNDHYDDDVRTPYIGFRCARSL
jgi:formylglycine-generating enzyme required for sulfatase activity